jgi:hypothetical protein
VGRGHGPHGPHEQALLHAEASFAVQGAIFEVNRQMGAGVLEAVYQECLVLEFKARAIPFVASPSLSLTYTGVTLRQRYQADNVARRISTIFAPQGGGWVCW